MLTLEDDYKHWLKSEGAGQGTIRNYSSNFRAFANWCKERGIDALELNVDVSRDYMVWLQERPNLHNGKPLSSNTRIKHYNTLQSMSRYLRYRGLYEGVSLVEGVRRPARKQAVIQGFSLEQLQLILDAVRDVRTTPRYKERMVLLLYTLACTGLRISEALTVRVNDMDHHRRLMVVLGKGNKERIVPFSTEVSSLVTEYVDRYNIDHQDLLFASRYGKPLQTSTIRDALRHTKKALGNTLGIDQIRVSPHTFRHTFARLWVTRGGNTIALSRIMGHTTTAMTSAYVKMWGVDLGEAYDQCAPGSGIVIPRFAA